MSGWKVAGIVAGIAAAGWLVLVLVAVVTAVKGGRLIEEAAAEWPD